MLELLTGFKQIELCLLQLADVGGGNIVTTHLYGGLNLRVQIDHLGFQALLIFRQQLFRGHHLRH